MALLENPADRFLSPRLWFGSSLRDVSETFVIKLRPEARVAGWETAVKATTLLLFLLWPGSFV